MALYEDDPELADLLERWRAAQLQMIAAQEAEHHAFARVTSRDPILLDELLSIADLSDEAKEATEEWLRLDAEYQPRSRQYLEEHRHN